MQAPPRVRYKAHKDIFNGAMPAAMASGKPGEWEAYGLVHSPQNNTPATDEGPGELEAGDFRN